MKVDFRKTCPIKLFPFITVLDSFSSNNFLVGGSVRDLVLGQVPHDYDIVTDIPMHTLITLFEEGGFSVSQTGVSHLVLNVSLGEFLVEISNFRKDVSCDGRHADVAVGTIDDDAHRRDFTVNALYVNTKTSELVDPTGQGMKDLHDRVLRFVGRPKDRIREDAIRILRFYRFVGTKKFTPDPKSMRACREMFGSVYEHLTPERVRLELEKMAGL